MYSAPPTTGIPLLAAAANELEHFDQPSSPNMNYHLHSDEFEPSSTARQASASSARQGRGACRRCKKMKMKCVYTDDTSPCARCNANGHACSVEPRKTVSQKSGRAELKLQSQRKDELIRALVQHINKSVSVGDAPSSSSGSGSSSSSLSASPEFAAAAQAIAPGYGVPSRPLTVVDLATLEIIRSGAILAREVPPLFAAFFQYMNPQFPLLDPSLHHASAVFDCCTFLFTTICAVAAQYLPRPDAFPRAMDCARKAAADALISDRKTVHMCQAYILLGEFSPPADTWEEDRTSLFRGLALRLALDLNLGGSASRDHQRTWLVCAFLDTQLSCTGHWPPAMPRDGLLRTMQSWAIGTANTDAFLCACVELSGAASRFGELLGRNGKADGGVSVSGTLRVFEDAVSAVAEDWSRQLDGRSVQAKWFTFLYHHCKLQTLASVLQQPNTDVDGLFLRAWHAALACMTTLADLARASAPGSDRNAISTAPESMLGPAVYAARTILQLLGSREHPIPISPESRSVAAELVAKLVAALESGGTTSSPAVVRGQALRAVLGESRLVE